MTLILSQILFMEGRINYLLNYVMNIAIHVKNLDMISIIKNVKHAYLIILMIIGIILIILILRIVFL